jgi:ABC-type transporter Mla MlaB component
MLESTKHTSSTMFQFVPDEDINLPFTVTNSLGVVLITLAPRAVMDALLVDYRSYLWVRGVQGQVVVDFSRVEAINSSCCNWLVNLMHSAKPATVSIIGATWRVAETLRILRLDVLMAVNGAPVRPAGQQQRPRPPSGVGDLPGLH